MISIKDGDLFSFKDKISQGQTHILTFSAIEAYDLYVFPLQAMIKSLQRIWTWFQMKIKASSLLKQAEHQRHLGLQQQTNFATPDVCSNFELHISSLKITSDVSPSSIKVNCSIWLPLLSIKWLHVHAEKLHAYPQIWRIVYARSWLQRAQRQIRREELIISTHEALKRTNKWRLNRIQI